EGNRYRVQRTNPRGKTSSVEFFILFRIPGEDPQWKPLTERTLRETDKKIEDTLRMDFDTFTNASFFLQGKADQFATARPGERKRILSNILGLEVWETYRETAAQRRRDKEKEVKALEGRISEIQAELDEGPQRKKRLAELEVQLNALAQQRKARAQDLDNVRRLQAALEEQRKMVDSLRVQLDAAAQKRERTAKTLEERYSEKQGYDAVLAKADHIERAYQDWQKARQELEAMEAVAEKFRKHEALRHEPLSLIQAEQARLTQEKQSLEDKQSALEKARSEAETLKTRLSETQEKIENVKKQLKRREELDEEVRQLQAQHAEAKAENPRLFTEMKELRERIDQLEAAQGVDCPLCGQPLSVDERQALIQTLTEQGNIMGDRYRENKQLLEDFEDRLKKVGAQLADLKGVEVELREATRAADQLENQLKLFKENEKEWQENDAPRLARIKTKLAEGTFAVDARDRLKEIDAELAGFGYELETHQRLREAEQVGREAEADLRALEGARAALAPIEREIEGLQTQLEEQDQDMQTLRKSHDEGVAQLAAAEVDMPDMAQAESDLHDIQEQENRLRMEVGGAKQKVAVLEPLKTREAGFVEEREGLTQLIADLKQLERAFGKDGVPALLIEQALPEIEKITNDLLSRLTNGRMSFSFMTQREYKDASREDLRETLDIIISDSVGERDYEMFSGGEAFRINFSIRLALSQVLARRAGARLQTLVIDEGFGSQDAQGRQRLVEAINLVRDDFEKILVITHLEELKDVFPNRIEVEKTPQGSKLTVE
ncbi:MAG: SMC family ATPase, partial [Chloroflexota bacterium]|nr:SMC family ATPase [Chloroflexota bacterium]